MRATLLTAVLAMTSCLSFGCAGEDLDLEPAEFDESEQALSVVIVKKSGATGWGSQGNTNAECLHASSHVCYMAVRDPLLGPDGGNGQRFMQICQGDLDSSGRDAVTWGIEKLNAQLEAWHFQADTSHGCQVTANDPADSTAIWFDNDATINPPAGSTDLRDYVKVGFYGCSTMQESVSIPGVHHECRVKVRVASEKLKLHPTFTDDAKTARQAIMYGILVAIGMGEQSTNTGMFTYRYLHSQVQARTNALTGNQQCRANSVDDDISIIPYFGYESTGC